MYFDLLVVAAAGKGREKGIGGKGKGRREGNGRRMGRKSRRVWGGGGWGGVRDDRGEKGRGRRVGL